MSPNCDDLRGAAEHSLAGLANLMRLFGIRTTSAIADQAEGCEIIEPKVSHAETGKGVEDHKS